MKWNEAKKLDIQNVRIYLDNWQYVAGDVDGKLFILIIFVFC